MGSLRDIRREASIGKRPTPKDVRLFRINQAIDKIFEEPYSDAFLMGPPGSGKTIGALTVALHLIKEITSKADPWNYYGLDPIHSFNIIYLSEFHEGIFSSVVTNLVEKMVRPQIKVNLSRTRDGYDFLNGNGHLRFLQLNSGREALTMGYKTVALIMDSETFWHDRLAAKTWATPKECLPDPWKRHIFNSRNMGEKTLVVVTRPGTIKSELKATLFRG